MTSIAHTLDARQTLPRDANQALLVGRAWLPATPQDIGGPTPVTVRDGQLLDIRDVAATTSALLALPDAVARVRACAGRPLGTLDQWLASTCGALDDPSRPRLLAPNDLQVVKAAGVTFVDSMVERVIEEQARGDASRAETVRR